MRATAIMTLLALVAGCLELPQDQLVPRERVRVGQVTPLGGAAGGFVVPSVEAGYWPDEPDVVDAVAPADLAEDFAPVDLTPPPPELSLTGLSVEAGSIHGGTLVTIEGEGFEPNMRVWFGDAEAPDPFTVTSEYLNLHTPPHAAGLVDVVVERPDGVTAELPQAFWYTATFAVLSLTPELGPTPGGTLVTLVGEGLEAPVRVIVGGRPAVTSDLLDSETLEFTAPPGDLGPAAVVVESGGERFDTEAWFRYVEPPLVQGVAPPSGPLRGEELVRVTGRGLDGGTVITFDDRKAAPVSVHAGHWIDVRPPPGEPGLADVRATSIWGSHALKGAYLYHDEALAQAPVHAFGLWPRAGDRDGGEPVTLFATGLKGDVRVLFGDAQAEVVALAQEQGWLRVISPPGDPGAASVTLLVEGAPLAVPGGYTYTEPMRLEAMTPPRGDQAGGTQVVLSGARIPEGPVEVRFDGFVAPLAERLDATTVRVITPAAAPGPSRVTLLAGGARAEAEGLYRFTTAAHELLSVSPADAAYSGDTRLVIRGLGLEEVSHVDVGGEPCAHLERRSSVELACDSPRLPIGLHDVVAYGPDWHAGLEDALRTFNPRKAKGGTSGEPLAGTLHVTVIEGGSGAGVHGATVYLRLPDGGGRARTTDQDGHVTFSFDGLVGPVDVTGVKPGYTAYSALGIQASRLSFYLNTYDDPAAGSGTPSQPYQKQFSTVSGHVLGVDKYVPIPVDRCEPHASDAAVLCRPCAADADCVDAEEPEQIAACLPVGPLAELACVTACADAADCPERFACRLMEDGYQGCLPLLGERSVRCDVSRKSILGGSAAPSALAEVNAHGVYQLTSRPGDVAIICWAGVRTFADATFLPVAMGVHRNLFVPQGTTLLDVDVLLDIPLSRVVHFDPVTLPPHPEGNEPIDLKAYVDLGVDGVISLQFGPIVDDEGLLVVPGFPQQLEGALADTSYAFYATVRSLAPSWYPYAAFLEQDVTQLTDGGVLVEDEAGWSLIPLDTPHDLLAFAGGASDDVYAVGASGVLLYQGGDGWFPQYTETDADLRAICRFGGRVLAVGAGGVARMKSPGGPFAPLDLGTDRDLHACTTRDGRFLLGGWGVILHETEAGAWSKLYLGVDERVLGFVSAGGKLLAFTDRGGLHRSSGPAWLPTPTPWADEPLSAGVDEWLVSESGRVFRHDGEAWALDVALDRPLYAVSRDGARVCAAGARGGLWCRDEAGVWARPEGLPDDLPDLLALLALPDGALLASGRQAHRMGPFMAYPQLVKPGLDMTLSEREIKWALAPAERPSYHQIVLLDPAVGAFWTIVAGGDVRAIHLPPGPLPSTSMTMLFTSAFAPGFDIDHYKYSDLGTYDRRTWSMNYLNLMVAPELVAPL